MTRQPFRVTRIAPGTNYQTVAVTAQWHDDAWYAPGGAATIGTRRQPGAGVGIPRPLVGSVIDSHGTDQFGITESTTESTDGSFSVELACAFVPPAKPGSSGAAIPLLSLDASIATTGGTIAGGQTLYYAVSAIDPGGVESGLSFVVPAKIPAGTSTNAVTLSGLSFSSGTAGFNVYRGTNPQELLRIAANVAVASTYTDGGTAASLIGPPDENYDHANFYWRLELQPESATDTFSATTIGNSTLAMLTNDFVGGLVRITRGTGIAQERSVIANSATTLMVAPAWTTIPDATSFFVVADATWRFGGLGATSPVNIEVPNQTGATVEVSGRSANPNHQESAEALNPVTRWQIGGAAGGGVDSEVPPAPAFGLTPAGQGTVDLAGVSFTSLTNTHTISAGTLILYYWDELASPSTFSLAAAAGSGDATITLASAGPAAIGDFVQIEAEILRVTAIAGAAYTVDRGSLGSTAAAHGSGVAVYHLKRDVTIVPFVEDFFGSPASGSFVESIFLPDARIGAAEFWVTNVRGAGPAAHVSYGATTDQGLRTLAGGQLSIQIDGYLAIETDAAPPLVIESAHAARDIFATVNEAPSGGPVQMQLRQGSTVYCTLTIADGATTSNVVDGFGLSPLAAGALVSLDILSVPGSSSALPGRDLTVTVRL